MNQSAQEKALFKLNKKYLEYLNTDKINEKDSTQTMKQYFIEAKEILEK